MPERPAPVERLDSLHSTATIAHEAIFDLHRELVARGRGTAEAAALLDESARIALRGLPRLTATARDLAASLDEESVLDPDAEGLRLSQLAVEIERIYPEAMRLLGRQRQIAARLREMVGG
jgi:hypothetical protein